MKNYWKELTEFCGTQSAGRFGFLLSVVLSNVIVWYVWAFVCTWSRSIVDIPTGVWTLYGLANGIAFTGKVTQSLAERPASEQKNSLTTSTTTTQIGG